MSEVTCVDDGNPGRPDGLFVLTAGLYVAAILGPIAVALIRRVATHAAVLYGSLLVAATGGIVLGGLAVRGRAGVAERLGDTPTAWVLVVAPLVGLAAAVGVETVVAGWLEEVDVLLGLLGGFGAALLGFVLVSMAKTRYAAWVLDDATVEAEWSAPPPPRWRRRARLAGGALVVLTGLGFVSGAVFDRPAVRIAGQVLFPVGIVLLATNRTLTYRATDGGVEVRAPVARRYLPWSAFAGYRRSPDGVVLVRTEPYRRSLRCDPAAIADPEAVESALSAHLDRLE